MAKLTLNHVDSLQSEASAMATLNANFDAIEDALEITLSRDGTAPNFLASNLDLNDQRIINLAAPISGSDAARLTDVANALSVDSTLVPSMTGQEDKIMSNDGSILVWRAPSEIPDLGDLIAANNLSDVASAATSRNNLGLGTAALEDIGTSGANVGLLNANLTFSGTHTITGFVSMSAGATLSGNTDYRLTATPTVLNSDSLGYRGTPLNTQDATYTLVLTDAGKQILHTSASTHTWTIPPNSSVAYPLGTIIALANTGSGAVTISRGSGVALRIAGTATDANASIAQHGLATISKLGTDSWYIAGAGVS